MIWSKGPAPQVNRLPDIRLSRGEHSQFEVGPAYCQAHSCLNLGLTCKLVCQARRKIIQQLADGIIRASETIGIC